MKQCPFYAETIKDEATICRYCSRDLPQEEIHEEGINLDITVFTIVL